ncbi:hypothetical protein E2C01_017266 [Portunus trituberculatus]|uniref:Uncharacterized protein n=1 Tax=Portunus trituberculatus TaxID=210409 RepID=A0A5B7DRW5_PORTR|nr:hypothetical protein [Portunus trituberculatus]
MYRREHHRQYQWQDGVRYQRQTGHNSLGFETAEWYREEPIEKA